MINQIKRYKYSLSALWTKVENGKVNDALRLVCGSIICGVSDNPYEMDHKQFEDEYLKSDDGLKMIKDGWQFRLSVSLIIDQSTNVFTTND